MPELKCLLWDVDGTLADTERDGHRVAFNMAFAEAGLERRWDEVTYGKLLSVTGGKERMRYDIELGGMPALSDEEIARLHARKTILYQQLIADGKIPLRPGVRRLLEAAYAESITLGVATTTTPAALEVLIEHGLGVEWFDRFAVLAAGDIVPAKKPAPDIYDYALEQLQMDASEALAIEDSGHGLRAAKSAGLKCVVAINGYTVGQEYGDADLLVSELGDPGRVPIEVLSNPHALAGLDYVSLDHLKAIMAV